MFGKIKNAVAKLTGNTSGTQPVQADGHRLPVDNDTLVQWAKDAIDEKFETGMEFTAWEITQAIRLAHPGYDISHSVVRSIVNHQLMAPVVNAGLYTVELRQYSGGIQAANTYVPVVQPSTYAPA